MFFPEEDFSYREKGIASWYGQKFHGKKTANGEIFNMNLLTAAHRTLQLPSLVKVTQILRFAFFSAFAILASSSELRRFI